MTPADAHPAPGGGDVCSAEHAGWLTIRRCGGCSTTRGASSRASSRPATPPSTWAGAGILYPADGRDGGPDGRVVAVDLQAAMLDRLRLRAEHAGLAARITAHQCTVETIGELPAADAALAFYMVHEAPDVARFLGEVSGAFKPGGRFLLVEPRGHVSASVFAATVETATPPVCGRWLRLACAWAGRRCSN